MVPPGGSKGCFPRGCVVTRLMRSTAIAVLFSVGVVVAVPPARAEGTGAIDSVAIDVGVGSTLVVSTGPNTLVVTSDVPMADSALDPAAYAVVRADDPTATLMVLRAVFVGTDQRVVELTTASQEATAYTLTIPPTAATDRVGTPGSIGADAAAAVEAVDDPDAAVAGPRIGVGFNGDAGKIAARGRRHDRSRGRGCGLVE